MDLNTILLIATLVGIVVGLLAIPLALGRKDQILTTIASEIVGLRADIKEAIEDHAALDKDHALTAKGLDEITCQVSDHEDRIRTLEAS